MTKLTQRKVNRMPIVDQHAAYLTHEFNTVEGRNKSRGPSVSAQTRLYNNWFEAISNWKDSLPA